MRYTRLILVTTVMIIFAAAVSECMYWYLMVPRLSQYHLHAPILLWIVILCPYGLASLIVGLLTKTARIIPMNSLVASLAVVVGRLSFLFITRHSPGHDVQWADLVDLHELIWSIPRLLVVSVIFAVIMYAGYGIRVGAQKMRMGNAA